MKNLNANRQTKKQRIAELVTERASNILETMIEEFAIEPKYREVIASDIFHAKYPPTKRYSQSEEGDYGY
jgi:hypothetical protein